MHQILNTLYVMTPRSYLHLDHETLKVNVEKAANVLSFHPTGNVRSIVNNLIDNQDSFKDWDNPAYSNFQTFKRIENGIEVHDMVGAA